MIFKHRGSLRRGAVPCSFSYTGLRTKTMLPMHKIVRIFAFAIAIFIFSGQVLLAGSTDDESEPAGLLLTWQFDPTSTMTIDWHTEPGDEAKPTVRYKPLGGEEWEVRVADEHEFPYSSRTIHRIELTDLEADSHYRFQVGEFERKYKFRTMPESLDERTVTFATGGDTMHEQEMMQRTNRVALEYDPDFVAWGGDLAYADGDPDAVDDWYEWFEAIMTDLISEEGHVVPILNGIGNHELTRGYWSNYQRYENTDEWRTEMAPYYYELFAFPGHPGYATLDFGDYLSLIFLDSDHAVPLASQTEWLEQELRERERRGVTHQFPIYHIPGYPSHRDYEGTIQTRVREHWVPLFEEYDNVRVAFENHDHTYKRTHPILDGQVDEDGVVYIGDGAWGVYTRDGDSQDEWYIDEFASERHAIIVTLDGAVQEYEVVSEDGEVIDSYETEAP